MPVREVTVLAAGGTIAMAGAAGAVPELDADALLAAVPELGGHAGLRARTLGSWPGVHVTPADALAVARAAVAEAAARCTPRGRSARRTPSPRARSPRRGPARWAGWPRGRKRSGRRRRAGRRC